MSVMNALEWNSFIMCGRRTKRNSRKVSDQNATKLSGSMNTQYWIFVYKLDGLVDMYIGVNTRFFFFQQSVTHR